MLYATIAIRQLQIYVPAFDRVAVALTVDELLTSASMSSNVSGCSSGSSFGSCSSSTPSVSVSSTPEPSRRKLMSATSNEMLGDCAPTCAVLTDELQIGTAPHVTAASRLQVCTCCAITELLKINYLINDNNSVYFCGDSPKVVNYLPISTIFTPNMLKLDADLQSYSVQT